MDVGKVYDSMRNDQLPKCRRMVDRFNVANRFDMVDDLRKKPRKVQVQLSGRTEAISVAGSRRDPKTLTPVQRKAPIELPS